MASMKQIAEQIVEEAGIPASTMTTISRRMADEAVVTQGSPGRTAPTMTSKDCANLIFGALAATDGYGTVGTRITSRVREIGDIRFPKNFMAAWDDSIEAAVDSKRQVTFVEAIANLLTMATTNSHREHLQKSICRVGVVFRGDGVSGCIEFTPKAKLKKFKESKSSKFKVRIEKSHAGSRLLISPGRTNSMVREAYFTWDSIQRIADLGAKDNPDWGT